MFKTYPTIPLINRRERPVPMDRHLEILTYGRSAFIDAIETLANAFPARFLHDRWNIPQIELKGAFACGKSLLVETMMKTWSDDHTLSDVYGNEKRFMFLEGRICDAMQTVSQEFNVQSKKTALIFNSSYRINEFIGKIFTQISDNKGLDGCAIFFGVERVHEWPDAWLRIDIPYADFEKDWERKIEITVENLTLWNDPQFQKGWAALSKLAGIATPERQLQPAP